MATTNLREKMIPNYIMHFDAQPDDTPTQLLAREVAMWLTMAFALLVLVAIYFFNNRAQFWRIYRAITR
jgi:hypothetical protein